eukprot:scaffold626_cov337-Pavlova_lutheri.AAC.49
MNGERPITRGRKEGNQGIPSACRWTMGGPRIPCALVKEGWIRWGQRGVKRRGSNNHMQELERNQPRLGMETR